MGRETQPLVLQYDDQIDFFIDVIAWHKGKSKEELGIQHDAGKYLETIEEYIAKTPRTSLVDKLLADSQAVDILEKADKNFNKHTFWVFLDDLRYGIEHKWNKACFKALVKAIGKPEYLKKAKPDRTKPKISSQAETIIGKTFSIYVPTFKNKTELIGVTTAQIEFKNFVKVELRIFDPVQNRVAMLDGSFTFSRNGNYLLTEFDNGDQRYFFEMQDIQVSRTLFGVYYNLKVSHDAIPTVLDNDASKTIAPGFYNKESTNKEIVDYFFNYIEANKRLVIVQRVDISTIKTVEDMKLHHRYFYEQVTGREHPSRIKRTGNDLYLIKFTNEKIYNFWAVLLHLAGLTCLVFFWPIIKQLFFDYNNISFSNWIKLAALAIFWAWRLNAITDEPTQSSNPEFTRNTGIV